MQDHDEVSQTAKLSRVLRWPGICRRHIATEAAFVQRAEPMRGGLLPGQIKPGNALGVQTSSDSPKEAHNVRAKPPKVGLSDQLGGPYRSVTMFVLKDKVQVARKFYNCDASEMWRSYGLPENELTAEERLVLDGVKADKWRIRPGQRYRCLVFRDGRELVTQRARLDMDSLCQKHDLYDDA